MINAPATGRTQSLALAFQDVIVVILRTRFRTQRVTNAEVFRASVRKMISAAVQEVRAYGYSDETSQMALYAIIGFLDESILNCQDPVFADWSRRPLQEEMFGGHFAGEYFFRHVTELLNKPASSEVADILELHALCLMLGYRGRFAFGDSSEVDAILRRIRAAILRMRGNYSLFLVPDVPVIPPAPTGDRWVRRLTLVTIVIAALTLVLVVGYKLLLLSRAHASTQAALQHVVEVVL